MSIRSYHLLTLCCVAALTACNGARPSTETFVWKGPLAADTWLRLRNVNGDFEIRQGTGDSAEIKLVIDRSSASAPGARVKVLKTSDGTLACVVYGDDNACSSAEYRSGRSDRRGFLPFLRGRTSVSGSILLPKGVKLDAETTNGDIDVAALGADLVVKTVNGDIDISGTRGSVTINTTNGDIELGVEQLGSSLTIETTNGDVSLELPSPVNAALDMRTTNGELDLGLAGNVTTKTARQIIATLGTGGSPIDIATVNGGIRLRQRSTP